MFTLKRIILLTSYFLLLFLLLMLFVATDIVDRPDNPLTIIDIIPFVLWAIVFAVHHILSYLYMRRNDRVFSFQLICSLADLNFLWYFLSTNYVRFKEWMLLWVIGLRIGSLLLVNKER